MPESRTAYFDSLVDTTRAACWRSGYRAPAPWVRWLLTLEVERIAARTQVSFDEAAGTVTLEEAAALGEELVRATARDRGSTEGPDAL